MNIIVERIASCPDCTLGLMRIDGAFECFTLEDQAQYGPKVPDETRIPAGTYALELRRMGKLHKSYSARFGESFHRGMLWLRRVPNFRWIYIHLGNRDDHSSGCLLVGMQPQPKGKDWEVMSSEVAYRIVYPRIAAAIEKGEAVSIQVIDRENVQSVLTS